jgi:MoaE-MoaD fusion protein
MDDRITVTVLLFASLAERAGTRALEVVVPPGLPVGGVWAHLPAAATGGGPPPQGMRWAVNRSWASPGVALCDGDEVGVLTPVSGG